ncbi:MAG: (2Fe-2S)-binding protein [Firmicutes bacterium]|jgi:NAD(P)H-nitrite reductase large subunit|nr:(2Fe-2S)-binding protein [Bacillota bacterium]
MRDRDKVCVCRCEEITEEELLAAIEDGAQTLQEVKRATRAGMGLCKGRTCTNQVCQIIARALGKTVEQVGQASTRGPLRPITLEVLATGHAEEKAKPSVAKGH